MPATGVLFIAGSLAICGLPPFNGFVSELLVYLGLARAAAGPGTAWVALPAPVLAASGALVVACFVKVVGIVFLGTARSAAAAEAHESPSTMLAVMALLAALCALLGVAPALVVPALESAVAVWARGTLSAPFSGPALATLAPLAWVSGGAVLVVAFAGLLALVLLPVSRRARRRQPALPTWDCGYASSSPRVQYTGSSFSEIVTSRFAWALRPREQRPVIDRSFPARAAFRSQVEDTVLDRFLLPRVARIRRVAARIRAFHHGKLQEYVLYMVAAIAVLLLFNVRLEWVIQQLWGR
jgi:hydrogenase-4 component B